MAGSAARATLRPEADTALAEGNVEAGDEPTPQDVAELVAFLCSERAGFVTGAVIPVIGQREV